MEWLFGNRYHRAAPEEGKSPIAIRLPRGKQSRCRERQAAPQLALRDALQRRCAPARGLVASVRWTFANETLTNVTRALKKRDAMQLGRIVAEFVRIPLCSQIGILTNSVVRGGDHSNLRRASGGEFVLARGLNDLGPLALGLEAHGDASQQEEQRVVDRRVAHLVKHHLHGVGGQSP
jgi:hypothetical protein